ncbi:MAG: hypothetical protein Q7R95_05885 [bacterium]|nr:hypothetical protein [bacterium]
MERIQLIKKYAEKFGENQTPYSYRYDLVEQLLNEWDGIRSLETRNCNLSDVRGCTENNHKCNLWNTKKKNY